MGLCAIEGLCTFRLLTAACGCSTGGESPTGDLQAFRQEALRTPKATPWTRDILLPVNRKGTTHSNVHKGR
jgi:hypothetical protein